MVAEPLEKGLGEDIEKGKVNIEWEKRRLSDFFTKNYDWDRRLFRWGLVLFGVFGVGVWRFNYISRTRIHVIVFCKEAPQHGVFVPELNFYTCSSHYFEWSWRFGGGKHNQSQDCRIQTTQRATRYINLQATNLDSK